MEDDYREQKPCPDETYESRQSQVFGCIGRRKDIGDCLSALAGHGTYVLHELYGTSYCSRGEAAVVEVYRVCGRYGVYDLAELPMNGQSQFIE